MDLKRALLATYTLVVGAALLFAPSLPGTLFGAALLGLATLALFVSAGRAEDWLGTSKPR